jgi:short-subunit dehydrogenase
MNIVITGASKGIGKAIAEKFAAAKHTVFICSRNEAHLFKTKEELETNYPDCKMHAKAADISIKSQATEFAEWCLQSDIPDIVVNNAGEFLPGSVYNEPEGTLEKMMQGNLFSAYYITRVFLPKMMDRRSGHIFNMCSIASLKAYHNGGSYGISKFALAGFSKNLREEMKPYNIKVTSIFPGAAYTDSWRSTGIDATRFMEAADIAEMVYTASQLSFGACVEDIVLRPQLGDI